MRTVSDMVEVHYQDLVLDFVDMKSLEAHFIDIVKKSNFIKDSVKVLEIDYYTNQLVGGNVEFAVTLTLE